MLAAFSDSHPTLYVVDGRDKPVLHGPSSTEYNLFHHGETTYRSDACPRILLYCFVARNSACDRRSWWLRRVAGGRSRSCSWWRCTAGVHFYWREWRMRDWFWQNYITCTQDIQRGASPHIFWSTDRLSLEKSFICHIYHRFLKTLPLLTIYCVFLSYNVHPLLLGFKVLL